MFLLQIFHVGSLNDLEHHKPLLTKFQSFNPRSISVSWEASDFEEFPEVFGLSENDREGPGVTSRAATTRPVRLLYFSSAVSSADQRGCVDDKLLSVSLPIGRSQVEDDDCL